MTAMKLNQIQLLRMWDWLVVTLVLLIVIYLVKPELLQVDIHKISLLSIGGLIGYGFDRSAFPNGRPRAFMERPFSLAAPFVAALVPRPGQEALLIASWHRRAFLIGLGMLAASLGL